MYVYLAKFRNEEDAIKIGKSVNIPTRIKKLSKTHGDVVNLRYIKCETEKISLIVEGLIHNMFCLKDMLGEQVSDDDYNVIEGEGYTEFFAEDAVMSRLSFIEDLAKEFGYKLQCAKIEKNLLIDISLEEFYELELNNFQWYVENVHWGKIHKKKGLDYEIDKRVLEILSTDKKERGACINEYIKIENILKERYTKKIEVADKYMPKKISNFELRKKDYFIEHHYHILSMTKRYPLSSEGNKKELLRLMKMLDVDINIIYKMKEDNLEIPNDYQERNKTLVKLHKKVSEEIRMLEAA